MTSPAVKESQRVKICLAPGLKRRGEAQCRRRRREARDVRSGDPVARYRPVSVRAEAELIVGCSGTQRILEQELVCRGPEDADATEVVAIPVARDWQVAALS